MTMTNKLADIAHRMVASGKGILAADESTGSIAKRLESINTPSTPDSRRDYREMLFGASEAMKANISGVILFDETLRQKARNGVALVDVIKSTGAVPGIKLDTGAKPLALSPGETVTEGLDGLAARVEEYARLGAEFAKWRAVIDVGKHIPTHNAIHANAHALARYAILCQEAGIVPVVEPEVMGDGEPGNHSLERCASVTGDVLENVFKELRLAGVDLSGMLLKPNMVLPGINSRERPSFEDVARRTVAVLREHVPAAVPGIAFLSGGQTDEEATAHLSAMNQITGKPWPLTFSYGRALQNVALRTWAGRRENFPAAQAAFTHRARMNSLAALGTWTGELDRAA